MRSIQIPVLCTLFFTIMVVTGCQGGPATPGIEPHPELSGSDAARTTLSHHLLGFYQIQVNTEDYKIEVIPLRSNSWHFNLTGILNTTMGISVVSVPGEADPPNGLFVFDVTLTHPFETQTQFSGFDVKGVLITPGTLNIGSLVFADANETDLENADGYTRWWNPTEFTAPGILGYTDGILPHAPAAGLTATVNPYKLYADLLNTDDGLELLVAEPLDGEGGRAVFTAGSSNTRRYRIRFPMDPGPQVVYGYAVDCSWNPSVPSPPAEVPDDFPMDANQPEAWRVTLHPMVNTLYYDSPTGIGGGVLRLLVNIHDWQGEAAGNIHDEITAVRIYAPDLMPGGVDAVFQYETVTQITYSLDLTGTAIPTAPGGVKIICGVESSSGNYTQAGAPAPDAPVTAYQAITLDIVDPECSVDYDNIFSNATWIDPGTNASGVVCPVTDVTDFYYFNIPLTYEVSGDILIYSDAGPIIATLYDHSHNVIGEETISGMSAFSLDDHPLLPGNIFISIAADPTGDIRPYFLELDAELIDVSPCGAVDVTPDTLMVDADFIFMNGNYAFLIGYYGIWVFDVTDPGNPVQISYVETRGAMYADFRYPYCYGLRHNWSSGWDQLDMVDFSDPYNPIVHADLMHYTDNAGPAICMDEQYLYFQHMDPPDYKILIFDYATDPTNPTLVTDIDTILSPEVMAVTEIPIHGKFLVVGGYLNLWGYRIENLEMISEVTPYALTDSTGVNNIACDDETVYVTHHTGAWDFWLYTLQLDDFGLNFVYFDKIELTFNAYSMLLDEPYLYMGSGDGLSVFDVSIPSAPVFDNSYEMIDYGRSMDKSGDTLCVIPGDSGLEFFDMTDPTSPFHYPHLPVCNNPEDIAAIGDYLFVIDSSQKDDVVLTLDISDPANTFVAASYTPPGDPDLIYAYWTNLLITYNDGVNKWMILDASDPLNLSEITTQTFAGSDCAIVLTDDAVYVATSFPEVLVFDYSVSPPLVTGGIMLADTPKEMTVGLDHLYVTTYSGIEILSLADPLSPGYEGVYTPTDDQEMCEVAGDYLYITGDSTLEVASLADPSNPVFVSSLEVTTIDDIDELAIDGQYVFVTGYETPIFAIQRMPIDAPSFSCYIHEIDDYSCYKIIAHEGFLYEMNEYQGVQIYDY